MNLLTKIARIYLFGVAIFWTFIGVMTLVVQLVGSLLFLPQLFIIPSLLFGRIGVFSPLWVGPDPIMSIEFFALLLALAAGFGFVALKMVSHQKKWIYLWYVYSLIYIIMSLFLLINADIPYNRFWPVLIQHFIPLIPGCIIFLATYLIHRSYRGLPLRTEIR